MAADKDLPRTNRREFLKLMGGALGGVSLGMYGGGARGQGGGPGGPILPNGYNFYRVFTLGAVNPFPFAPLTDINPGVMLTEQSQIIFHATNSAGLRGVYALSMDYSQATPRVSAGGKIVEVGDTLPADGRPVHRIAVGDTNATGSYATVIGTDNPGTQITPPASPNLSPNSSAAATPNPGTADSNWVPQSASPASVAPPITASTVYIQKDPSSGLQPLVNLGSPTPPLDAQGTHGQFGAIHGDIALQDDNSVLLTAHYSLYNKNTGPLGVPIGPEAKQGLFNLTGGVASDQGTLVQTTGDMLPQPGAILTAIGLVDVASDGYYVAQAYGAAPGQSVPRGALQPSVRINGHVGQPASQARLLAASAALRPGGNVVKGETFLGPRVGRGNVVGHVTHQSGTVHRLTYHRGKTPTVLRQTSNPVGDDSGITQGIGPSVIGPTGLAYFAEVILDSTGNQVTQLFVSNGDTNKLLLSSLDPVNPGGYATEIHFGYHTAQTDSAGRIAFLGEFLSGLNADPTNPGNITTSIVVGIPV